MSRLARSLVLASLVLGGVAAMASTATAAQQARGHRSGSPGPHTYVVTTLAATGPGSLADAIEQANADEFRGGERDRIVFEVAGVIEPGGTLPAIGAPVDLDATTAPGYEPGAPTVVVELAGSGTPGAGLTVGQEGSGSEISGLGISGFERGVVIVGDETTLAENLISGNEGDGVVVLGSHDHLVGNLIGTDATGNGPRPNGAAGVRVGSEAVATLIGGTGANGPGNTIAFNLGAGVAVEAGATETRISSNSIFANGARGIEVPPGAATPAAPVLTGFSGSAMTSVAGVMAGEPEAAYTLEFFAGEACEPSQGQTFLGAGTVTTDADGRVEFEAIGLAPLPAGAKFITATATGGAGRSTSAFSGCLGEPEFVAPEEAPPSPHHSVLRAPETSTPATPAIVPINGVTITIEPKTGKVRVRAPGDTRFRPLTELESVPIGSLVDATEGKARIASATAIEEVQSASFFGGVFRVLQSQGRTLTTMRLFDAEFEPCSAPGAAPAPSQITSNHLWGSGKGRFRTEGSFGSATVRGTIWYVADRCRSTLFKVNRGIVSVRDFPRSRTVTLRAGNTYAAAP
jgi:hypothetical protein